MKYSKTTAAGPLNNGNTVKVGANLHYALKDQLHHVFASILLHLFIFRIYYFIRKLCLFSITMTNFIIPSRKIRVIKIL